MVKHYRDAELIKLQRMEQQVWLQGVYIYEALIKVSPILHAFSKKGAKPEPYSIKPHGIFKRKTKEEKQLEKKLELEKVKVFFENWVTANSTIKK